MASTHAANANNCFVFRRRICFDESMQRLGLEVTWRDPPVVAFVTPGSDADQQGILPGDSIISVNGMNSVGQTRAEVLLKLKERPLALELDHSTHADSAHP